MKVIPLGGHKPATLLHPYRLEKITATRNDLMQTVRALDIALAAIRYCEENNLEIPLEALPAIQDLEKIRFPNALARPDSDFVKLQAVFQSASGGIERAMTPLQHQDFMKKTEAQLNA